MTVAALLRHELDLALQIRWAERIATARKEDLLLLFPVQRPGPARVVDIGLKPDPEGDDTQAVEALRQCIEASPNLRAGAPDGDGKEPAAEDEPGVVRVRLKTLQCPDLVRSLSTTLQEEIRTSKVELLVVIRKQYDVSDPELNAERKQFTKRIPCAIVYLVLGNVEDASCSRILVPASRTIHSKAALQLACDIAEPEGIEVTALHVNPDVGPDSESVGQRIIERSLKRALGAGHEKVRGSVVVNSNVLGGIREACEAVEYDLVVVGASNLGLVGQQLYGTVGTKLLRGGVDRPIAIVRAAKPLTDRFTKMAEQRMVRFVPQLEREHRIDLVERIQASSQWDFDFFALMTLSTFIAAMGLVQNSAAVIIGAMLVAPLMTPLLGLGLALVQGNPVFARMALRSVVRGFLVSFAVGVIVGLASVGFDEPTPEIMSRGGPGLLDLFVAFAAGLAAAYATCRPGLLAALPGVAIAAALVPPLASAGLLFSQGWFALTGGALLLFFINMVTIVFASTLSLWAVGIRNLKKRSRWIESSRTVMVGTILLLAVYLSIYPPRRTIDTTMPPGLIPAIEGRLGTTYRFRQLDVAHDERGVELIVRVAGKEPAPNSLADDIRAIAREHFEAPVQVRMVTRFLKPPPK